MGIDYYGISLMGFSFIVWKFYDHVGIFLKVSTAMSMNHVLFLPYLLFCYKINFLLTENGETISAQPQTSAHLESGT